MNQREVGELRRRLRPEKTSITHIVGCYVNEKKEIVSRFNQSIGVLSPEEGEKVLALLKKSLSGSLGKNLLDITFSTKQVMEGDNHKLLMTLRDGGTKDEAVLETFYEKVAASVHMETGFVILLAADAYDVPFKGKDDLELAEGSETVFRYILCSICPVKLSKPALTYTLNAGEFHNRVIDYVVASPELGFLFPAFDDRAANIYSAAFYTRDASQGHEDFVSAVFDVEAPMPAALQKESFSSVLGLSLDDECSMDTVQAVRSQLCAMIQEHKESKEPEALIIPKGTVKGVLMSCGISEDKLEVFDREYDAAFGEGADLSPRNVVDPKKMEVKTPDVTIKVNPDRPELVETRMLDGARYILIRAEEGVEVNGVPIQITEAAHAE